MFGKMLKEVRLEKEISRQELAVYLLVDPSTVARWERGVNEPDFETLVKLARYFDVTTDYLLGREV